MHRHARITVRPAAAVLGVLSLLAVAACGASSHGGKAALEPPPVSATPGVSIEQYVRAWDHRDWAAMAEVVAAPRGGFVADTSAAYRQLAATAVSVRTARAVQHATTATVAVTQHVTVSTLGSVTLHSTLDLRRIKGRWLVEWTPAAIDHRLTRGDRFERSSVFAPRATITGAGDQPLVVADHQVEVGVVGQRLKNPALVTQLLLAAGATTAQITPALAAAKAHPTYFEPVFPISQADFTTKVKGSPVYAVPGTAFQSVTNLVAATPSLGTYLIGGVGPITAQQLTQLGPSYGVGDVVGQGGLEQQYQRRLAGAAGTDVTIVNPHNVTLATIGRFPAVAGRAVRTTISLPVQQAAEAAIAATTAPAALVAVQASTGKLLAVATHDPTAAADNDEDYALDATEAPGSTFKTITSTALIGDKGLTPQSPATCPTTRTVDGEVFHNDEGEAFGNIDLLSAFAQSCNTAFIGLATSNLTAAQLVAAAKTYRIGISPQMGFPAYGGTVPAPTDEADLASTSIGQGQITVAPLDLAMVAAAIDTGQVRAPRLVVGAPDDTVEPTALNATVDADLKVMMTAVVASGTAAGQGLPVGTEAKTGTAEFGSAKPPQTHAWLIGFRGDVAFAVFVNVGTSGGAVAAPLAAKFLDAIGTDDGA